MNIITSLKAFRKPLHFIFMNRFSQRVPFLEMRALFDSEFFAKIDPKEKEALPETFNSVEYVRSVPCL